MCARVQLVSHMQRSTAQMGQLWTCGDNKFGQLGHGADTERETTLKRIVKFRRITVCTIAAGVSHTVVNTEGGDVWTCGRGFFYQLGHGDRKDV